MECLPKKKEEENGANLVRYKPYAIVYRDHPGTEDQGVGTSKPATLDLSSFANCSDEFGVVCCRDVRRGTFQQASPNGG